MKVRFLAVAEAELTEVVSYYNEESEGLGYELAATRVFSFVPAYEGGESVEQGPLHVRGLRAHL